ncbi:MAG: hypothetical protein GX803_04900 [Lentisphaerae bacterium]|jgi:hypothetical protein|nr:hypothetical protein [Lentisphaerota bacterium]
MASVNEWMVREYLEALGFLVRQPRKYQVIARAKGAHEEVDLLALNPLVKGEGEIPDTMLWGARELGQVAGAIVAVRGWHSGKFTAAMVAGSPEITRFAGPAAARAAAAEMGLKRPAKVLCLGDLPTKAEQRQGTLDYLRKQGIDGVILFREMLHELIERIDVNKAYEKSDLLQTLRILKNYDLLRGRQMDLFKPAKRRKGGRGRLKAEPPVSDEGGTEEGEE